MLLLQEIGLVVYRLGVSRFRVTLSILQGLGIQAS